MGVDDNGAGVAIERARDASGCSNALERKDRELFEGEGGREWCATDTSTIDKNVLCQCPALQQRVSFSAHGTILELFVSHLANIQ